MADPLRKPLETDFTVEPFSEPALPENTADVREIEPRDRDRKLVNAAETVGSTLGNAVGTIREKVQSGLEVVKMRSAEQGASVEDLAGKMRDRAGEIQEQTKERIQEWSSTAQQRIQSLRVRTRRFSQERPAELILAIGGIAMIAGVILRLWRSSRD
ncbi:MAG TPA: hypothetical protein VFU86_17780 [Terriglobales bacterium]|nr:hypothetical protein [Terriglobales bacterium]